MPNHILSFCTLAFLVNAVTNGTTKTLSPFPPAFSFAGSWSCSGTFRGNMTHKANFTGSVAIDGRWLALTEIDVEPVTGYEATYLIGYDPAERGLLEFDANTFGAATYRSIQGWEADALIMESPESPSPKHSYVADRFVYLVANLPHTFTVEWQLKAKHESPWVVADHLSCKATGSA